MPHEYGSSAVFSAKKLIVPVINDHFHVISSESNCGPLLRYEVEECSGRVQILDQVYNDLAKAFRRNEHFASIIKAEDDSSIIEGLIFDLVPNKMFLRIDFVGNEVLEINVWPRDLVRRL